jgi:hypothetical protein
MASAGDANGRTEVTACCGLAGFEISIVLVYPLGAGRAHDLLAFVAAWPFA